MISTFPIFGHHPRTLTTKTPRPGPRCPGPRLSLATARFLQPAGHMLRAMIFLGHQQVEQACAPKKSLVPQIMFMCCFFVFFSGWFLGWCPFHKVLGENNQQEESVKIIPANCSCSLGVFILMSQDGNLKEFSSCRKSKPPNHKIQLHLQLRL